MINVSNVAMRRMSADQLVALQRIIKSDDDMTVAIDFSLPPDYICFTHNGIYGGIDGQGRVST